MLLKLYQNQSVNELLESSLKYLNSNSPKKIIFKSPTGSGKTIIMAEYLKQLCMNEKKYSDISIIWSAPRQLHTQSKEKLEKYFDSTVDLECKEFNELTNNQIDFNEILFMNWESINKKDKNILLKENERDFYLNKIIENTKNAGRKIIFIIDESHHHATSEISKNLIKDIAPDLTIEVSATPNISDPDKMISVEIDDVIQEGMIKKRLILNGGMIKSNTQNQILENHYSDSSDEFILELAINKSKELKEEYKKNNSEVNPLILIQLPDKKIKNENDKLESIKKILSDKFGINTENGKLSIYLSNEKSNLEEVENINSLTEVLIFKQAIALGWDCPRSQILILFRDWKSMNFSIQTVGRIMRMPEPDKGHYFSEDINQAYVYTNLEDINLASDISSEYIVTQSSKRNDDLYENISLKSIHIKRQRDLTRLSTEFITIFQEAAETLNLKKYLILDVNDAESKIIGETIIDNIDDRNKDLNTLNIKANSEDLQRMFDNFVIDNLNPFFPEGRSVSRIKESIYSYFKKNLNLNYQIELPKIISVVLNQKNKDRIISVIDLTKELYLEKRSKKINEIVKENNWEIPKEINFGKNYRIHESKKSILQPFLLNSSWKSEISFIQFLENNENVIWWFKNGDRDGTFFAIPYKENEEDKAFYIDFIIKFKDGAVGLFDTKSGLTVSDSINKIEGLNNYLEQNKNCIGGIITNTKKDYSGRWIYYNKKGSDLNKGDFSNWDEFPY